jgi:RNA polymerase sigma factor (sigma-70 family)
MQAGMKFDFQHEDENKHHRSISMNEYVLWKEFKVGDLAAYSLIYRKYFFVLYNYGKKLSDDHDLIKDCIQDLFIKIWDNRENLKDTTSIKYYLYTSLKRKLLDNLRSPHLKYRADEELSDFEMLHEEEPDNEVSYWQKEKVLKAINTLSTHQQKLLHLKYYRNLSNKEISEELGITVQSVYNAVFKALRSIRKKLMFIAIGFILFCL